MTKVRDIAAGRLSATSINNGPLAGFRNRIINGNFDVWQRALPAATAGTRIFGPDRFEVYQATATVLWSQGVFAAGQTDVPHNPMYYASLVIGSGGSGFYVGQRIEDVRTFAGQECTFSFYFRGNAVRMLTPTFRQNFGSGGSATVVTQANPVATTNGSWSKVEVTVTLPSVAGKTLGSGHYLSVVLENLDSGGFTLDLAQWQLELGNRATTFECRPYGLELSLAQRYYFRMPNPFLHVSGDTTTMSALVKYPVTMRAVPTIASTLTDANYVGTAPTGSQWNIQRGGVSYVSKSQTIVTIAGSGTDASCMSWHFNGGAGWNQAGTYLTTGPTAYIEGSAEL